MAITSARMQMRRGNEADFDPDKMHPGEWAVSTDEKYVRMCFSPGVCVRMATYEAFEEDMEQIISILEEAKTVQEAIEKIYEEFQKAELDIEAAENSAILSESYAHGGTGTREGEDTDNAKYYAEKAKELKESFEFPVSIENGGTGGTTAKEAQYNLLNDMNVLTSDVVDGDVFICAYNEQTAEKGAIYKRTVLTLWNYIKSKAEAIFATKTEVTPVNNLLATVPGSPLDAVQGKVLNDRVTTLEDAFVRYEVSLINGWTGYLVVVVNKINRQASITGFIDGTNATDTIFAKTNIEDNGVPVPVNAIGLIVQQSYNNTFVTIGFSHDGNGWRAKAPSISQVYLFSTGYVISS